MTTGDDEKLCTLCDTVKHETEFYPVRIAGFLMPYRRPYCIPCTKRLSAEYRKRPGKNTAYQRTYRQRLRERGLNQKGQPVKRQRSIQPSSNVGNRDERGRYVVK